MGHCGFGLKRLSGYVVLSDDYFFFRSLVEKDLGKKILDTLDHEKLRYFKAKKYPL